MDRPVRILLATDAWHPQTNGVVSTLTQTVRQLRKQGQVVRMVTPESFPGMPCPFYAEIRLCAPEVRYAIEDFGPDHIHIATEGPVGLAVRAYCTLFGYPFTTSYHTDFPAYLEGYLKVPRGVTYEYLRWFHGKAARTLVATGAVEEQLRRRGFRNLVRWSRGVDTDLFRPAGREVSAGAVGGGRPRPLLVCMGRVAKEKNIEAFLELRLPLAVDKRVIGGGPMLEEYRARYATETGAADDRPRVMFTGMLKGEALVQHVGAGDCFVFPSQTDTFGLVILEALACGVPVAAYPQPGPREVLTERGLGCVDADLRRAVMEALAHGDRRACRRQAERYSWARCTGQFAGHLAPARRGAAERTGRAGAAGAGRAVSPNHDPG